MAAQEIRATYDDLRAVESALEDLSARADAVFKDVDANRTGLSNEWKGFGYGKFSAEMDGEILPSLQNLTKALSTASATTKAILTQFDTTETEDGAKIKSISAPSLL